jgi:hypothetical protein
MCGRPIPEAFEVLTDSPRNMAATYNNVSSPPWSVEDIGAALVVQDSAGMRPAYCRGGIGVRDDGGTGVGLRAGVTDGCAGDSGIFAISSATAASNRVISRAIWS